MAEKIYITEEAAQAMASKYGLLAGSSRISVVERWLCSVKDSDSRPAFCGLHGEGMIKMAVNGKRVNLKCFCI